MTAPHTVVRIRPGRTLLGAGFLIALGYGIATMGWRSGHLYGLVAAGALVALFGAWVAFVAVRHAARVARAFAS